MQEQEIVETALENLQRETEIEGKWAEKGIPELDGKLTLKVNKKQLTFNVEVKTEVRGTLMPKILEWHEKFAPFLLIAERIHSRLKRELKNHQIAYLEGNGNFFLKNDDIWIIIDVNPPLPAEKETNNRAFTKTGLKVLFDFLADKELLQKPYREIAEQTQTSVGNVANIIQGLKKEQFIGSLDEKISGILDEQGLINRWVVEYDKRLKKELYIASFRMADSNRDWRDIKLDLTQTRWGGEPGGEILTNYLRPEELTLYTDETRNELMKNYKLIPDERGEIKAYRKFWSRQPENVTTVPPLLVYADLVNTQDKRCLETALKLYEQYIGPNL
jgi:hypothetical protein